MVPTRYWDTGLPYHYYLCVLFQRALHFRNNLGIKFASCKRAHLCVLMCRNVLFSKLAHVMHMWHNLSRVWHKMSACNLLISKDLAHSAHFCLPFFVNCLRQTARFCSLCHKFCPELHSFAYGMWYVYYILVFCSLAADAIPAPDADVKDGSRL